MGRTSHIPTMERSLDIGTPGQTIDFIHIKPVMVNMFVCTKCSHQMHIDPVLASALSAYERSGSITNEVAGRQFKQHNFKPNMHDSGHNSRRNSIRSDSYEDHNNEHNHFTSLPSRNQRPIHGNGRNSERGLIRSDIYGDHGASHNRSKIPSLPKRWNPFNSKNPFSHRF